MSKAKHYDEREEYAKTPWGNLKARNPEGVESNTSGERQRNQQFAKDAEKALAKIKLPLEKIEDAQALEKCPSLSPHIYKSIEIAPLSKGGSAHTTLSNAIDYIRSLKSTQAEYADKVQNALDATAAERDRLEIERVNLAADVEILVDERDKLLKQMVAWRILTQEMTPRGSEFMTPESVRAYYRAFKDDAHQAKLDRVKLRGQVRELLAVLKRIDSELEGTLPVTALVKEIARAAIKHASEAQ